MNEQKQWYNGIKSMYNSSKNLVDKTSDKLLIGAITLDALLGNPSMAYAGTASGNDQSSYRIWSMCVLGCISSSYYARKVGADRPKTRIMLSVASIGFGVAAICQAFSL